MSGEPKDPTWESPRAARPYRLPVLGGDVTLWAFLSARHSSLRPKGEAPAALDWRSRYDERRLEVRARSVRALAEVAYDPEPSRQLLSIKPNSEPTEGAMRFSSVFRAVLRRLSLVLGGRFWIEPVRQLSDGDVLRTPIIRASEVASLPFPPFLVMEMALALEWDPETPIGGEAALAGAGDRTPISPSPFLEDLLEPVPGSTKPGYEEFRRSWEGLERAAESLACLLRELREDATMETPEAAARAERQGFVRSRDALRRVEEEIEAIRGSLLRANSAHDAVLGRQRRGRPMQTTVAQAQAGATAFFWYEFCVAPADLAEMLGRALPVDKRSRDAEAKRDDAIREKDLASARKMFLNPDAWLLDERREPKEKI